MRYLPARAHERVCRAAVRSWQVSSSAALGGAGNGAEISLPGYPAAGWWVAPPRSTVMAAALDNGLYQGIEHSEAMAEVDRAQFEVPWWYRSTFSLRGGGRTAIRLDGVIPKADLWVNGALVAGAEGTAGAYTVSTCDVTHLVTSGTNALALKVYPGSPLEELAVSWVDWAQWPPDNNMGVWRDVVIERTGDVRLGVPAVTAELSLPGLEHADVTIWVELVNSSSAPVVAQLRGTISGGRDRAVLSRDVALAAGARQEVVLALRAPRGSGCATPGSGGPPGRVLSPCTTWNCPSRWRGSFPTSAAPLLGPGLSAATWLRAAAGDSSSTAGSYR